jgi:hypothetical protein
MTYTNFNTQFGNYTLYVKDEFVQPMIMKDNDKKQKKMDIETNNNYCISPTSSMIRLMKTSETNILFFTNNDRQSTLTATLQSTSCFFLILISSFSEMQLMTWQREPVFWS